MATRAAEWERSLREADNGAEPLRDVFIRLFLEADARLAGVEGTASSVAALQVLMTQDANTLINAVVTPLLAQIRAAADMGVLFSATSVSETAIGTGVKTFTIPVGMRTAFAPAAQLAIVAADDPAKAMWARKLGYNSETGVLTVDVYSTQGTGTVSSWSITAGIAASMAAHVAVAATGLVPVGNLQGALAALSAAISNDPDFGAGVLASLAARYTKAEADALLAGKQTATAASALLAGLTPAGDRLPYFSAGDAAALTPLSGFWRSVLGAADDTAARAALKAASSFNPEITGNLRFGVRSPIDSLVGTTFTGQRRAFVYDTRLDSDGGAWRARTHDTLAFTSPSGPSRGTRRDFPAIAILIARSPANSFQVYDAEQLTEQKAPALWVSTFMHVAEGDINAVVALNGIICVGMNGGLAVADIPGDVRYFYRSGRFDTYPGVGSNVPVNASRLSGDPSIAIGGYNIKDVAMRVLAGAATGLNGLPTPHILIATTNGLSLIDDEGNVANVTRTGGYVAVSFASDSEIKAVTPEGAVDYMPLPTSTHDASSFKTLSTSALISQTVGVSGEAEATTRGLVIRRPSAEEPLAVAMARISHNFNSGWMLNSVVRALFCDNTAGGVSGATPLADDCTSTTGWTLGAGWTHDTGEFDHASGTAALDRALSGLTAGVRYRVRFLVGNRSAGSLAVSLLTASDEAGALSVSANGEYVVGFTAGSTTDTLRFVPTSDFDGSVQDVRVEVSIADRSLRGRDARVVGALTAVKTANYGEIAQHTGWGAGNYVDDVYSADLDFVGDFFVAFFIRGAATDSTVIQRASAPSSGARWEVARLGSTLVFSVNDGTDGAEAIATIPIVDAFNHFVCTKVGAEIRVWMNGVVAATADASAVGSLANASATVRYGARVDASKPLPSGTEIKMVRIGSGTPLSDQVRDMWEQESDTIQLEASCCLGGPGSAATAVQTDPVTGQVVVAAKGVSTFKGLLRTGYFNSANSAMQDDDVVAVSISGATIAAVSDDGKTTAFRDELAAVMVEGSPLGCAPRGHEHPQATATMPGFMAAGDKAKLDGLNKTHVGLGNVDNTADTAKPVSTAQAAAIAAAVRIRPNVPQRNYLSGATWLSSTSAADNNWSGLCWAPELGLFVSVGASGTGNRVMTSPDGITWTVRTSAADNNWRSVCWSPELGLLVAVADSGTGDRVMTSPDGITWTTRASAADNSWVSVCWSPQRGLFVAIAGAGTNRVMTSPDGINWTSRSIGAQSWRRVIWAAELGLFIGSAGTGTGNRISTSADGITWVSRSTPADNDWRGLAWSPQLGLLAATALSGTGNRVMTSPDGVNWTIRTSPADNGWIFVEWSPQLGLFVAIAVVGVGTGDRVMTSPDGINWTVQTSATDNAWQVVRWSPELGLFCAVANSGTGNRAMTSVSAFKYPYRS
jgi:hypothetical protein